MTASNAATAGGSAVGSWFDGFLLIDTGVLLTFGISCTFVACSRSTVGTGTGCVGICTGSETVREGEIGRGADVIWLGCRILRSGFAFLAALFSSQVASIGGAAEYLNDLGTIIFAD